MMSIALQTLRAPREDGAVLIEPGWSEVGPLLAENQAARREAAYDFQGRRLDDLTAAARRDLLQEAVRWTSAYRDVPRLAENAAERILLAGHQPQLFHPGVWFKNFALDHLARRHAAVAVNLQIDSDTIKTTALRVPGGPAAAPHVLPVLMDTLGKPLPFEERRILNCAAFNDFGRRAAEEIRPLVGDPLLRQLWPLAVRRAQALNNLGLSLAQARHQLEGQWGLYTLEVPQSRICQSEPFLWLVAHLVAQLPRFQAVYNGAVREYRAAHGIRSAAHPVPDLSRDGDWQEAPFWIWTADDPQRRPLFVRERGGQRLLGDRRNVEIVLSFTPDGDASQAVEQLQAAVRRGVKIRSRALITTLWARLVLGDLFLHGIGGAKYDHVTDQLIARFFGLRPPGYLVLSATLLLPTPRPTAGTTSRGQIERQLRDLTWNPQRTLDGRCGPRDVDPQELVARKRQWIDTPPTPTNAWTRYHEIRRVNEALQPWVECRRRALLAERAMAIRAERAAAVLSGREYSFALYPEETLRAFYRRALPGAPV